MTIEYANSMQSKIKYMTIKAAISPCPNDTFIYGALANKLIETPHHLTFEYCDIEQLNQMAFAEKADLIKMSYYSYFKVEHKYRLLPCGGAMGVNCGPLLITKDKTNYEKANPVIAIPGIHTTANFLLHFFKNDNFTLLELPFDKIESALLEGLADAGVIIHENRFTYQQKGLTLITDLGQFWEDRTECPIPLGCLAIHRDINPAIDNEIIDMVQRSIIFARQHPDQLQTYINSHAQEMNSDVIQSHIELYVNDFSYDIGQEGKRAIQYMRKHLEDTPINKTPKVFEP